MKRLFKNLKDLQRLAKKQEAIVDKASKQIDRYTEKMLKKMEGAK